MRSSPSRAAFLSLVVVSMALPGRAQQSLRQAPVPGPVKNAGTYHVATGEWSRTQRTHGILGHDALYRNDLASGYWGFLDEGETANDEGRLPGEGVVLRHGYPETGTSDQYRITGFEFGYCAMTLNPTTYTLTFREAYAPCKNPAHYPVTAVFVQSDLPNDGCWVVAIDLSGTTLEFDLAADGGDGTWSNDNDLDDFGYSLNIDHGQGNGTGQLIAGPILAGRTDLPLSMGDGTVFKNPNLKGTGLGSEDLFWMDTPVVPSGCYFYSSCNPCANFHVVFFGEDTGPQSYCSPGNANSVSPGGAMLRSEGGFGTQAAAFNITDTPDEPGVLFTGPVQVQTPFACGTRCVGGGGLVRHGPFFPVGNTVRPMIDMTVSGNRNVQWWYRDPAYVGVCGASFNLSNALGM